MSSNIKIIYGYDTLCGWCYGFIPALRHLKKKYHELPIQVIPGGLFTGKGARPYSALVNHIQTNQIRLEQVTGNKPGNAFHTMINSENPPLAESAVPTHAIQQIKSLAPDRVLEFAHLLQEAHFGDGKDLNKVRTYNDLCEKHDLPELDTAAIVNATADDPLVAESYSLASGLGIRSFPTILLVDADDRVFSAVQNIYEPATFVAEFERQRDSYFKNSGSA
ncbi:MAG: hypothetical protein GY806_16225 [Gammaproteobacteria bacterium]|nr:hypothetical protein [Gammaproteobacteria bacterium]